MHLGVRLRVVCKFQLSATGGAGGDATIAPATAGAGAGVSLTNAVGGLTTGSLYLSQSATGGAGGSSYIAPTPNAAAGGSANSTLSVTDKSASTISRRSSMRRGAPGEIPIPIFLVRWQVRAGLKAMPRPRLLLPLPVVGQMSRRPPTLRQAPEVLV